MKSLLTREKTRNKKPKTNIATTKQNNYGEDYNEKKNTRMLQKYRKITTKNEKEKNYNDNDDVDEKKKK